MTGMEELVVISGKGGTGKTSLTASFCGSGRPSGDRGLRRRRGRLAPGALAPRPGTARVPKRAGGGHPAGGVHRLRIVFDPLAGSAPFYPCLPNRMFPRGPRIAATAAIASVLVRSGRTP